MSPQAPPVAIVGLVQHQKGSETRQRGVEREKQPSARTQRRRCPLVSIGHE